MKSLRLSEADYAAMLARRRVKASTAEPVVLRKPAPAERKESELERRFLQQLEQAGLTECCIREYYAINGRDFRLDFAWPSRKLYVEVQGMAHRIKGRHRADIEKRVLHMLAGWRVLEIGGAEIRNGKGIEWLKQLLAA